MNLNFQNKISKKTYQYNSLLLSFSIIIEKSSFLNMVSELNGGGIFIDNLLYNIDLFSLIFINCSSNSIGGGFYVKSNTVSMSFCCFFECGTRIYIGSNWGFAGAIESKNYSLCNFSQFTNCIPNSNFKGHILFSIYEGHQQMNNFNCSNILSINTWSSCTFSHDLSSYSLFNSFYNITGYDCLFTRKSSTITLCEKNNFISNKVQYGAINLQEHSMDVQNSIFYLNLNDFGIITSGNFRFFGCKTNKNNFGSYFTDLNCKILQTLILPIEISYFNCNFNDLTYFLNYNQFNYFLFIINLFFL